MVTVARPVVRCGSWPWLSDSDELEILISRISNWRCEFSDVSQFSHSFARYGVSQEFAISVSESQGFANRFSFCKFRKGFAMQVGSQSRSAWGWQCWCWLNLSTFCCSLARLRASSRFGFFVLICCLVIGLPAARASGAIRLLPSLPMCKLGIRVIRFGLGTSVTVTEVHSLGRPGPDPNAQKLNVTHTPAVNRAVTFRKTAICYHNTRAFQQL